MSVWAEPPAILPARGTRRAQYRRGRRGHIASGRTVTGAIVIHTAESILDSVGPDTGAERVTGFIGSRTDAGSYHDISDSDSVPHLVRYEDEAFHEATGGNRWSIGESAACRTIDWARMTTTQRDGFIDNMVDASCRAAYWCRTTHGIIVPPTRITARQYRAGMPGFTSHAELDPGRRSDPGNKPGQFPWATFLSRYEAESIEIRGARRPINPPVPAPPSKELSVSDVQTIIDRIDRQAEPLQQSREWSLIAIGEIRKVATAVGNVGRGVVIAVDMINRLTEADEAAHTETQRLITEISAALADLAPSPELVALEEQLLAAEAELAGAPDEEAEG